MRTSLLSAFVTGARTLLSLQLLGSVMMLAIAAWTLAVTGDVMRERDGLRERVIQLEGEMGARGIVVPDATNVVTADQRAATYPPTIDSVSERDEPNGISALIEGVLAPPPPLRVIVLHVRGEAEAASARELALKLQGGDDVSIAVHMGETQAGRPPGYVYYDGRQGRAASDFVARMHDAARDAGIAAWSAQLRGEALPARGEYSAERLDIVLPALPPAQENPAPRSP